MIKAKDGFRTAVLIVALLLAGCTASLQKEELSMDYIQKVDDRQYKINRAIQYGLIERPDRDHRDKFGAYYYSIHVAWAYGDEEEYERFYEELMLLLDELEDEVSLDKPGATPSNYGLGKQEL